MLRKVAVVVFALPVLLALWLWWGLPAHGDVRRLAREQPGRTAVMRQRAAEAEAAGRKPRFSQTWVPITRISKNLVHAVVVSEDAKFFGHEGVDWEAIQESAEADWKKGHFARGGSTITQQLAKNLFFSTHKSLFRKVRELVVARWLEKDLGKKRILEIYLNVIEWGDGVYGCEAAARRYYGTSCSALSEAQAAGLAAMIPNPRRINPAVGAARHARAQKRVLWRMVQAGYLRRSYGGLGAAPPPAEPDDRDEEGPEPVEPEAAPPTTAAAVPDVAVEPAPTEPPAAASPPAAEPVAESTPSPGGEQR